MLYNTISTAIYNLLSNLTDDTENLVFEKVMVGYPEKVALSLKPVCIYELYDTTQIHRNLRGKNILMDIQGAISIITKGGLNESVPNCYDAADTVLTSIFGDPTLSGVVADFMVNRVAYGPLAERKGKTSEKRHLDYACVITFTVRKSYKYT